MVAVKPQPTPQAHNQKVSKYANTKQAAKISSKLHEGSQQPFSHVVAKDSSCEAMNIFVVWSNEHLR